MATASTACLSPGKLLECSLCCCLYHEPAKLLQAWRMIVAARSVRARAARDSVQHLLLTPGAQLSGHLALHPQVRLDWARADCV